MTLESIGITQEQSEQVTLYRANGCESCIHTGYRGRTGIFEMMNLDSNLKSLILKTFDSNQIKDEALKMNMVTLRMDGVDKVLTGVSTIEEVIRVTQN
jgi:general secretion pathway protein E